MNKYLVLGFVFLFAFGGHSAAAATPPATAAAAPAAGTKGTSAKTAADKAKQKKKSKKKKRDQPARIAAAAAPPAAAAAAKPASGACTADVSNKTILAGQSFTITLTAAPSGTTGSKAYVITAPPQHGTLGSVSANGQVDYTAADDYSGSDTFSYTVAKAAQSPVAIKVCPIASDDTWRAADSKTPTTGTLSAKGGELGYSLLDTQGKPQTTLSVGHGKVTVYPRTGQFTYAPTSASYVGPDTFDFQVQSGTGDAALVSAKATETVIFGSWPPCESVDSYASRSTDTLTQMARPGGNDYNPDCADKVTAALRRKAASLNKEIMNLQELRDQPMSDDKLKDNNDQIQSDNAELQQIEKLGISPGDLLLGFKDYPAWYTYFFGGIAFTSIDKLFQNGSPVIGLNIDHRFASWFHATGVIEVTSAAESQLSQTISNPGLPQSSSSTAGHNALDANLEPYFPINYGDDIAPGAFGPIGLFGLRKRDGDSQFTYRRYMGFRDAINPDTYVDVLFGKTMGLSGSRAELRAQMPLPFGTFNNDSRFFIGAVANVHWKSSSASDSVVIYLTWNLPFQKLTGVSQSAASQ